MRFTVVADADLAAKVAMRADTTANSNRELPLSTLSSLKVSFNILFTLKFLFKDLSVL